VSIGRSNIGAVRADRALFPLLLVCALFAFTAGSLVQKAGCNQTSHWLLVRALANGTAQIDPWQSETCDKSYFEGHFYSNKAPGLSFVMLPFYAVVEGLGVMPQEGREAAWVLGLWAAALAGAVLLAVTSVAADRIERGQGAAVGLTLCLATLVLPFSTMLFAHVLSGLLLLVSFVLVWQARETGSTLRLVLAGLAAGYAVAVEFPVALVTFILGFYALSTRPHLRSGAAFVAGAVAGVVPALLYNRWAFGSFTHLPQEYGVVIGGQSGHDVVRESQVGEGTFFGIGTPSLEGFASILASDRGLLITAPVVAFALGALVALWRRGLRAETLVIAGSFLVVLTWNAGFQPAFGDPIGGDVPGPRYLISVLPLCVLPLALAYHAAPRTTGALAAVSAAVLGVATLTRPLLGSDDTSVWWTEAAHGRFTDTVLTLVGLGDGWIGIAPTLAGLLTLAVLAARAIDRSGQETWWNAGIAAVVWAVAASTLPSLEERESRVAAAAALGVVALLVLAAAWFVSRSESSRRALRPMIRGAEP
jgi:hypothetical protein